MVKNQAALKGGIGSDLFADDDPLAELARIVGFDAPQAQVSQPVARAEPAFDLEEELLREFETYRGPEQDVPSLSRAEHVAYAPDRLPTPSETPIVSDRQSAPAVEFEPLVIEPDLDFGFEVEPYAAEIEEARYSAEFEPVEFHPAEFQAAAAPSVEVQPVDAPTQAFAPMPWEEDYVSEPSSDPDQSEVAPVDASDDLANELELAIADIAPVSADVEMPARPAAAARLSLPLANFSVSSRQEPEAPIAAAPASVAVSSSRDLEWPPVDLEEDANLLAELELAADLDGLPDLKALDTDFTVSRAAAPVELSSPVAPVRREPDFTSSFAEALAADEETFVAPAPRDAVAPVAAPISVVPAPASTAAAMPGTPSRRELAPEDMFDPFADAEFELSLDDLELDLSEFGAEEDVSRPAPAPVTPVAPVRAPVATQAMPVTAAVVTPASAPSPVAAVVPDTAYRPVAAASFDETALPFDPTQIAEQDDHPAVIPALDVPDMPAPQVEEAPAYKPEYDFDIDSELASLFADTPVAEAAPVAAAAVPARNAGGRVEPQAQAPANRAAPSVAEDFDAFEKALEEDFRETLGRTDQPARARPTRVAIETVQDTAPSRSGGRRWMLVASVAAVAVLAVGGGYYWLSGGAATVLSSGEPPVILADKDPIKVVPENPGGASVPNQDKAVYDRVAGTVEDPKQEALISGSEEPVDVVQKTLMPESLPLEGENDVDLGGTPVGETEDPRLLPGEQPAEASGNTAEPEAVAIAPRKVRTMIVKADGTLVAQEVAAPAEEPAPTASNAATPTQPATPVEPVATSPVSQPDATPQMAAVEPPSAPAEQPSETSAPLPTTRPVEQPVNIVGTVTDQGNVRPTAPETTPAPTAETASAQPTAAETPAATPAPAGGYYIQIASLPSEAEAQRSYQSLSSRYGGVIGGKGVDIKKAEIAGKGTYYRVRIPAGTKAEAVTLCESYRSAGGTCLVAK